MGNIMKLALRLFTFALVSAVLLAVTNEVTKGPIEQQKMASKMEALNKVLPGCEYKEGDFGDFKTEESLLGELFIGTKDGETVGYAMTAAPNGYGGPIPLTVGVSAEGYVTQIHVGALQETAGLGSRVGEPEFQDQFIGIPADPETLRDNVDTLSGATISSSAVLTAVDEMLKYASTLVTPTFGDKEAILAEAAAASGEPAEPVVTTATYDVTGMGPFKVEIAVDDAGKIVSVTVPEHNETAGFGADLIADASVFDALVGQDIATAQIDVKSGVTLTSNAINDALKQAANGGSAEGAASYDVTGFAPFKVEVAVDEAGKIVSVTVPENGETPGFGADLIADTAVFDALVGQDIATAQIDVKSGVTLTSNAINDALKQAAAAFGGEEAIAGDPYTVKGMNKFTLYIDVQDGKIAAISAPAHNETPGFGADMLDALADQLVGADIATAQVDVKSGVTLTSNAINEALAQAAAANGVEVKKADAEQAEPAAAEAEEAEEETVPVSASAQSGASYEVTGMAPFTVNVEVDEAGKIVSVEIPENSETPGFGADLIADKAVFDALVGQDIADAQIDTKVGVTVTSDAINEALRMAAADFAPAAPAEDNAEEAAEPAQETAEVEYDVTGIAPFKVAIAVDEAGKIVSVTVPEHNETAGFGADLIADASIFDALVGQDIATAQIDVKSGVTLTSDAINDALKQAAAAAPAGETAAAPAAVEYDVTGIAPFKVAIAVDEAGKIVSVTVPEHNETAGFGADLIADASIFDALVGQDIATAQIDVKSGVTLTSDAINDALKQAAAAAPAGETAAAPAEVVYDVTGIAPFKVAIAVDEAGKIVSVTVPEHNETAGFGADLIADASIFDALVGQDIATAQIDVKSGVTLTSDAINDALAQAAKEVQ